MKRTLTLLTAALLAGAGHAADSTALRKIKEYLPELHGTIRGKYEYQPQINAGRFQVRNARFSLSGNVTRYTEYKAEIDLSEEGKIKMKDAFARLKPVDWGSITMGQMRVPFTIDAHRSPHSQYFANRSFIAKQVGDVRDVGATLAYTPKNLPLVVEAGIFNGSGLAEQQSWHKEVNYSAKVQVFPLKVWNITLSVQKIKPAGTTTHMFDVGTYVEWGRWHVEAEYLYKHYAHDAFSDVNAFNAFVNYDIPTRGFFHKVSLLARYDMMDDHWDGLTLDDNGRAVTTDYARQRITGGVTLSIDKPFLSDIRLNYEKYFYRDGGVPLESEQDKLCLELMVRF